MSLERKSVRVEKYWSRAKTDTKSWEHKANKTQWEKMGVVNCRQYAELTNPTKQSAFQSTQKKRLFQLTNCPLLNTTQEKLKPSPYTPKMPKQIREQLNKLIQTHNGDEAPGKTLCITTQFTQSTAAACWCRVILHWRYKWETINKLLNYIYQGGIYRRLDLWSLLLIISCCVWNLGNETGCWRQGFLRAEG